MRGLLLGYNRGKPRFDEISKDEQGNLTLPEQFMQAELPLTYMRLQTEVEQATVSVEAEAEIFNALLDRAIEVVRKHNRASVSLLQRRLRIGYSRAARLIDIMEEQGIIGPEEGGSRGRRVLTTGGEE